MAATLETSQSEPEAAEHLSRRKRVLKAQVEAASSREPMHPQISTSQLSMAFVYYSVQLQKAAVSKLESQLSELAARTKTNEDQHAVIRTEIEALRTDGLKYDKLLSENNESAHKYADAKVEDLRSELEKACADASVQIVTSDADIKALTWAHKRLEEKFEYQQQHISDAARQDESAKRQEELVQAVQQLLDSCSSMLESQNQGKASTAATPKCQKLQDMASRLREDFLRIAPSVKQSVTWPEKPLLSIETDEPQGRGSLTATNKKDHVAFRRAFSTSSTASYPSEPDESNAPDVHQTQDYLRLYDKYRRTYRIQKPQSEKRFIRRFLSRLDHRHAYYTQQRLLEKFPGKVSRKERPREMIEGGAQEFIHLDQLTWALVAESIASMTSGDFVNMTRLIV